MSGTSSRGRSWGDGRQDADCIGTSERALVVAMTTFMIVGRRVWLDAANGTFEAVRFMLLRHAECWVNHRACRRYEEKCPSGGVVSAGAMLCLVLSSSKQHRGAPLPQRIDAAHLSHAKERRHRDLPFPPGPAIGTNDQELTVMAQRPTRFPAELRLGSNVERA
jgi:hypothetical protein